MVFSTGGMRLYARGEDGSRGGRWSAAGEDLASEGRSFGVAFAADGRFASSSPRERSLERGDWQNGALAEALLAALREADEDHRRPDPGQRPMALPLRAHPRPHRRQPAPRGRIRFDRKVLAAML